MSLGGHKRDVTGLSAQTRAQLTEAEETAVSPRGVRGNRRYADGADERVLDDVDHDAEVVMLQERLDQMQRFSEAADQRATEHAQWRKQASEQLWRLEEQLRVSEERLKAAEEKLFQSRLALRMESLLGPGEEEEDVDEDGVHNTLGTVNTRTCSYA